MNIGKNILNLRRQKNITQEELAAELGVTAAAISKWENSNTLPDILMLCALADYFHTTTDELLGRNAKPMYAIIGASDPDLGLSIENLIKKYGFITKTICHNYPDTLAAAKADPDVTYLFLSFDQPMNEVEREEAEGLTSVESQSATPQQVLDGFEFYFKNMTAIQSLKADKTE